MLNAQKLRQDLNMFYCLWLWMDAVIVKRQDGYVVIAVFSSRDHPAHFVKSVKVTNFTTSH